MGIYHSTLLHSQDPKPPRGLSAILRLSLRTPKSHGGKAEQLGLNRLLQTAAETYPNGRIQTYPMGKDDESESIKATYSSLYSQAKENAAIIQQINGFNPGSPILIHFSDHWENIVWFWSVVLSGAIPVMSTPLSQDTDLRRKHLLGLTDLLESPICITRQSSIAMFDCDHGLKIHATEELHQKALAYTKTPLAVIAPSADSGSAPAMLMLTSGSTGNSKAVKITYKQILASVRGKASVREPAIGKPLLNWVGLDHVGSLVEIHMLAMSMGRDQVHVQPADVVSSPLLFLDLLSRHGASRTFAPNFFLSKLLTTVKVSGGDRIWDLSNLQMLVSGGEANDMDTCVATSKLLSTYGARPDVLVPGFGMTETCAGSIYNTDCPESDIRHGRSVGSLGHCVPGIEMRVTLDNGNGSRRVAKTGEVGDFEVRGDIVFKGYYRNETATAEALSPGGWFSTGDQALIDSDGNLNLMGRVKDIMNINGVKTSSADVQMAIDNAVAAKVSFVLCFPSRAPNAHTEQVTVVYIPHNSPIEPEETAAINQCISEASIVSTGSRPVVFGLRDSSMLPSSTLGKVPRAKMRSLYEKGVFDEDIKAHEASLATHRSNTVKMPANMLEAALLSDVAEVVGAEGLGEIGVDTPIFDMGFNSMDFIRLKRLVDKRMATTIPVITYLTSPTVRTLASNISSTYNISQTQDGRLAAPVYDPVVPLLPQGDKTPLWLVHPGVGEVLVFIGLSQQLADNDRPVYALRAPGFDPGQEPFGCIEDAVKTYHTAITKRQPHGPYAIAGYSYGSMLAFEVAKRLESESGATVKFVGSFNLPPHIKRRMRQLNWNMCLVNLASFLSLVPDSYVEEVDDGFQNDTREKALARVLGDLDRPRMLELGLDEDAIINWTGVAYALQSMAVDYEPSGAVDSMDVFHAIPLKIAAKSREDWIENHLSKWNDFTRQDVKFHQVGGGHYTMMGPDHVVSFSKTLKKALAERGI